MFNVELKHLCFKEEQPASQIFSTRGKVQKKIQNSEVELTSVEEVTAQLPRSPARTRRGKAPNLDQVNKGNKDLPDPKVGVLTPMITRSSKMRPEAMAKISETETKRVTTPTRGHRGKCSGKKLKNFEQTNPSPPVSPKRMSLRSSGIKSKNLIDVPAAEQENLKSQEQIVDTPRTRLRSSNIGKLADECKDLPKKTILLEQAEESTLTKVTKQGDSSVRQMRERILSAILEESEDERLNASHPEDSQPMEPNADQDDQTKSTRLTRTRLSKASKFPDPSTVTFASTTTTPRRRNNTKGIFAFMLLYSHC